LGVFHTKITFQIKKRVARIAYCVRIRAMARIPPQDLDAEKAVLGSIMLRPGALAEIEGVLSPDSFYSEKNRLVFGIMLSLFAKNEPIDLLSVSARLKENKILDNIGGRSYLAELVEQVPASTNVKHYAGIVAKKALLRALIESGDYISEIGFNEAIDIEDVLDKAEKRIFGVVSQPRQSQVISIGEKVNSAWERLERLQGKENGLRGLSTGYRDLDSMLSGLQNSDLAILAARPSMGKTTLALDLVRNVAVKQNIPVIIFSLEMSAEQLTDRLLAAESSVNAWQLRTGKIRGDNEFGQIRDALDRLAKAPIFIDDQPSNTITKMRSTARRLKLEQGLGLIVVDYLQLMTTNKNYDSMVNQVTEISRSLKALARELDLPVLALSQLSRAVEARGGKPRLSDLRDSGSLEQDADLVMFIHRDDKYNEDSNKPNVAEILIEKHRNGPTGKIELYFDPKTISFLTMEKSEFKGLEVFEKGELP